MRHMSSLLLTPSNIAENIYNKSVDKLNAINNKVNSNNLITMTASYDEQFTIVNKSKVVVFYKVGEVNSFEKQLLTNEFLNKENKSYTKLMEYCESKFPSASIYFIIDGSIIEKESQWVYQSTDRIENVYLVDTFNFRKLLETDDEEIEYKFLNKFNNSVIISMNMSIYGADDGIQIWYRQLNI